MNLSRVLADDEVREELLAQLGPRGPERRPWGIIGGSLSTRLPRDLLREGVENPNALIPGVDEREAIIRLFGRPVLFVRRNSFDTQTVEDPESKVWADRLKDARSLIETALPAVGRIEVRDHPRMSWIGTGWLVAAGILVTNRHVANEFAYRAPGKYQPRRSPNGEKLRPSVNFRCEYQEDEESEYRVEEVLHIEEEDGPDLALLRLRATSTVGDPLPRPIDLDEAPPVPGRRVAVIGYPAEDGRRNDPWVMERVFRGVYGVKRLAPGEVIGAYGDYFTHDCSTLGGNSGSAVVDLETGRAVGLHFGGAYARENYAIPAGVVSARVRALAARG